MIGVEIGDSYTSRGMRRVYFDLCCLNRPFDDQTQARIRVEAEAVCSALRQLLKIAEGRDPRPLVLVQTDRPVTEHLFSCPSHPISACHV